MSEPRVHRVVETENITVSEHVSVVKRRDDRIIGFSESERDGTQGAADLLEDGSVHMALGGVVPQGETDTLSVCRMFITKLNSLGEDWQEPKTGTEPADCEAQSTADPTQLLQIQVIRALSDPSVWKQLAHHYESSSAWTVEQLLTEVEAAIRKKAAQYPPEVCARLTLVLDANRLPVMVLDDIRDQIVRRLHPVCRSLRFSRVWLVGPTAELSYELSGEAA